MSTPHQTDVTTRLNIFIHTYERFYYFIMYDVCTSGWVNSFDENTVK